MGLINAAIFTGEAHVVVKQKKHNLVTAEPWRVPPQCLAESHPSDEISNTSLDPPGPRKF